MEVLTLIISIIALVAACLAYAKKGGSVEEIKIKVEAINASTETLRSKMADILDNLEKKVRGEEKKSPDPPVDKGCSN